MANWLDKYNDDVPNAQNGIEGTMGGLTDQGFNYNGAWGGTMAMGGSLPGSAGFMYARTQSPAPSNGPYAKKTKASAQTGEAIVKTDTGGGGAPDDGYIKLDPTKFSLTTTTGVSETFDPNNAKWKGQSTEWLQKRISNAELLVQAIKDAKSLSKSEWQEKYKGASFAAVGEGRAQPILPDFYNDYKKKDDPFIQDWSQARDQAKNELLMQSRWTANKEKAKKEALDFLGQYKNQNEFLSNIPTEAAKKYGYTPGELENLSAWDFLSKDAVAKAYYAINSNQGFTLPQDPTNEMTCANGVCTIENMIGVDFSPLKGAKGVYYDKKTGRTIPQYNPTWLENDNYKKVGYRKLDPREFPQPGDIAQYTDEGVTHHMELVLDSLSQGQGLLVYNNYSQTNDNKPGEGKELRVFNPGTYQPQEFEKTEYFRLTPEAQQKALSRNPTYLKKLEAKKAFESSEDYKKFMETQEYIKANQEKYNKFSQLNPQDWRNGGKTSAQNGQEMRFYQQGLDWKPKTISKNGGWLSKYDCEDCKAQAGLSINDKRKKILERFQQIFDSGETPYDIPEQFKSVGLRQPVCIQGVCGVLSDAGVIPSGYYTNTDFANKSENLGLSAALTDINLLQPGDVIQYLQDENKQGNRYPSHAEVYKGVKEGDPNTLQFYDYFDYYNKPFAKSSGIREYTKDEIKQRLDRRANQDQSDIQAQFFSIAGSSMNPKSEGNILPEDYYTSTHELHTDYSLPNLEKIKPEDLGDRDRLKKDLVKLFNNESLDTSLIKKLKITDQDLQKIKPLVYGVLGQETNFGDPSGTKASLKYALENFLKPDDWSLGPGQIKLKSIPGKTRRAFDIKKDEDLYDINKIYPAIVDMVRNSAAHTDAYLKPKYNKATGKMESPHPELEDKDRFERGLYFYNSPKIVRKRDSELNSPLRMDAGSYPTKVLERAQELGRDIDFTDIGILPGVVITPEKKNGGWLNKYKEGGIIEDDMGQWAHPGEITKINSNQITMQGVDYPVLGISDTGDTQLMQPDQDYTFDGKSVTEIPMMQGGGEVIKVKQPDGSFKTYNTNSEEYRKLYDSGNLMNYDKSTDTYFAKPLDEVVITGQAPEKGFWDQSVSSFLDKNKDAGLLGALSSVVTYPLGLPQQAMMYGLTGKVQDPSEALDIENPLLAFGVNSVADPTNLLGIGLADDALRLSNRAGKLFSKERALTEDLGNLDIAKQMKQMNRFFSEDQRFDKLKETTNPESLSMLSDFKKRISTPEGKRRMKELGITRKDMLDALTIVEDPTSYGYYRPSKNKIAIHPDIPLPRIVGRHEVEHGVQRAFLQSLIDKSNKWYNFFSGPIRKKTTEIDDILSDLELKDKPDLNKVWEKDDVDDFPKPIDVSDYKDKVLDRQLATDYFTTGSKGKEKSAFLAEVQQWMMDKGMLPKDSYVEVTPEMVKEAYADAMFDKDGRYLRIFNIMRPTEKNYKKISKGLNKMLAVSPMILGTGAIGSQINQPTQQKNGGWLNKYK